MNADPSPSGQNLWDRVNPTMTLRDFWAVVLRRKWFIAIALVATIGGAAVMVQRQADVYEGEAQMLVRSLPGDSVFNTQTNSPNDAARFIATEIQVLEGASVRQRVADDLGITGEVPKADGSSIGATDVVAVRVRSHDAATASLLANAYVQAYIEVKREQSVNSLLEAAAQVQSKIRDLQTQIDGLDAQVAAAPADQRESLRESLSDQRGTLSDQRSMFQERLDQIQVDAELQSGSAQLVSPATTPTSPVAPTPKTTLLLAGLVGLLLGLGAAFLADYLDDSITSVETLERGSNGLPVMSVIPDSASTDGRPLAIGRSTSPEAEAYRTLRTTLQFLSIDQPIHTVQFTSAMPGEGKTTTAANVAAVFAQAGKRVIALDCDLRRPALHHMFGMENSTGLTTWLLGEPLNGLVRSYAVEGGQLAVLPAGPVPTNPSELLGSQRMRTLLSELSQLFDVVVIDSGPVLPVSDAVVLAGLVDAVVVVSRSGQTSMRQMREALARLAPVAAPVAGTVLNRVSRRRSKAYGYGYGYGYGVAKDAKPAKAR